MVTTAHMAARFTLRELLEEHGIGQSGMARLSGVSFATINRMCTNATAQVSLETLDKLLAAFWASGIEAGLDDIIAVTPDKKRRGK